MTERKLKRILSSKPYLMDGLFVRSRFEAQQMALESPLTLEQVLQSIRQTSDISAATWARVDLALMAKERRDCEQTTHKERTRDLNCGIKTRRRIVAVVAAMILAVAFFTLIPIGRTMAKGAFDYFMNVFENHIKFEPTGKSSIYPQLVDSTSISDSEVVNEYGDVIVDYDNVEAFRDSYGLVPVRLVATDFSCTKITLTKYAAAGMSLTSQYSSQNGDIVITQKWLMNDNVNVGSNTEEWIKTIILEDVELTYCFDKTDGIFDGFALLNDSILWISAQPGVNILDELSELAQ